MFIVLRCLFVSIETLECHVLRYLYGRKQGHLHLKCSIGVGVQTTAS